MHWKIIKTVDWCRPVLLLGIAAYVICLGIGIYSTRGWLLTNDTPLMQYVAQSILAGAVPYRDIFDMNMPLVYLIHMAQQLIFPPTDFGFRCFDLAWLSFISLSMALFVRTEGRITQVCAVCFFASYHLSLGNLQMGQRDFFMCPFVLLAAHAMRRAGENQSSNYLAISGLMLGIAISIKPTIAPLGACLLAYLPSVLPWKNMPRCIFFFALGCSFVPLLMILWLTLNGALPYFIELVTGYLLPIYSQVSRMPYDSIFHFILISSGIFTSFLLIPYRTNRSAGLHNIAMLGLLGGAFHCFLQGKGWAYHIYPFIAFLSMLAATRVEGLYHTTPSYAKTLFTGCCLIGIYTFTQGYALCRYNLMPASITHVEELAADIASHITPADQVQVLDTNWGALNALYRLNVRLPTRFMYDFQFYVLTDDPFIQNLRIEFLQQLKDTPPKLVVLTTMQYPNTEGLLRIEHFPELVSYLKNTYNPIVTKPGYIIYERL